MRGNVIKKLFLSNLFTNSDNDNKETQKQFKTCALKNTTGFLGPWVCHKKQIACLSEQEIVAIVDIKERILRHA